VTIGEGGTPIDGAQAGRLPPGPRHVDTHSDYDVLPYPSMPIANTQPAHLAAVTSLFGIAAPAIDRARVLELGCAAGGNIIPLAVRFPHASFTGIDLSSRHVDDGRLAIAALGLNNIDLRQADLTDLTFDDQPFDYVICHGVFSWVPSATQDAIFRICSHALAPGGMATISYNVFPGWHLRTVIRDLCLYYAGGDGTPLHRVARARAALDHIASGAGKDQPYGLLLQTEARRLRDMPSSYILGEFLAANNSPCYVRDFIRRAEQHGLDYVCEADLSAAVPHTASRFVPSTGADLAAHEQLIDFTTGRPFRNSVLVRRHPDSARRSPPDAGRLRALHLSSPMRRESAQAAKAQANPAGDSGPGWIAGIDAALARLAAAYPATLSVDELVAQPGQDSEAPADFATRLCDALFPMVLAGQVSISVRPVRAGHASEQRPRAWAVARREAGLDQPWMTSLRHAAVPLTPILRVLLPHIDGMHERAALCARLAAALRSGMVEVAELPRGGPPPPIEQFGLIVEHYVERVLQYLAMHGLLEPPAD
jgi:methyltransferase-like protein